MRTITTADLKKKMQGTGDTVLVDVLEQDSFRSGHLPGAINIPMDNKFDERIEQRIPDKSTAVAAYCSSETCPMSEKAAQRLDKLGYTNVFDYVGGKEAWQSEGHSLETGAETTAAAGAR